MAAAHRTANRAKAKARTRRAANRHRDHERPVRLSAWLGAGALTLGVGAALAGGSAVASAAPSQTDGSGSSATSSESAGKKTSTRGPESSTGTGVSDTKTGSADADDDTAAPNSESSTSGKSSTKTRGSTRSADMDADSTTGGAESSTDSDDSSDIEPSTSDADDTTTSVGIANPMPAAVPGAPSAPTAPSNSSVLLASALPATGRDRLSDISGATPAATQETTAVIDVETDHPVGVAVTPDGKTVYVTGTDTTVIRDGAVVTVIQAEGNFSYGVVVSPDGKTAYITYSAADKVGVIDTDTNQETATIVVGDNPRGVAVSADGTTLYVVNHGDGSVSVINTATNTVSRTVAVGGTPRDVAISPNGRRIYITNDQTHSVSVIDTRTGQVTATIAIAANADAGTHVTATSPGALAVSPDGKRLYVANYGDGSVSVISTATNRVVSTIHIGHGDSPTGMTVSSDGRRVYVANSNQGTVSVIDTATNMVVDTLTVGGTPHDVAVSHDGRQLYVTDTESGSVSLLAAPTVGAPTNWVSRALQSIGIIGFGTGLPPHFRPEAYVSVANVVSNFLKVAALPFTVGVQALDGQWSEIPATIANTVATAFSSLLIGLPGSIATSLAWVIDGPRPLAPTTPLDGVVVEESGSTGLLISAAYTHERVTTFVTNLTSTTLYYDGVTPTTNEKRFVVSAPALYTKLEPGKSHAFTFVNFDGMVGYGGGVVYSRQDNYQKYTAEFREWIYTFVDNKQTTDCTAGGNNACSTLYNSNQDHNNQAFFMDAPGTTITINPSDPAATQTLIDLCDNGGAASCKFKATRQEDIFTERKPVGNAVANESAEAVSTTITVTDMQTYTNSLGGGLRASGSVFGLVNMEISATYSHTWASAHTFAQAITTTVKGGNIVQIESANPMYRVYGDFTITLGNTTVHINDVYFDSPNPNMPAAYVVTEKPIVPPNPATTGGPPLPTAV